MHRGIDRNTSKLFYIVISAFILIGGFARFYKLGEKFYWGDEVFTSMRVSGLDSHQLNTKLEKIHNSITTTGIFKSNVLPSKDSSIKDLIHSLKEEDSQHPPLFFVLNYFWLNFSSPDTYNQRAVSAIFGTLGIISIFFLGIELFGSYLYAILASFIFSLSPLQILYSQQNREYSMWVFMTIISSTFLLKAIRKNRKTDWILYSIFATLSLYTYLNALLVLLAHLSFVIVNNDFKTEIRKRTFWSLAIAGSAFIPWAYIVATHTDVILRTTGFTKSPVVLIDYLSMLGLVLSRLFLDIGTWTIWDRPLTFAESFLPIFSGASMTFLGLIGILKFRTDRNRLFLFFIFAFSAAPWLMADIIYGGKRALVVRYLMPSWICIYLGVTATIADWLSKTNLKKISALALIILVIIFSTLSMSRFFLTTSWWTSRPTQVAADIESLQKLAPLPTILADQTRSQFALFSLAFQVPEETKLILSNDPIKVLHLVKDEDKILAFDISPKVLTALKNNFSIENYKDGKFYFLRRLH